MILVGGFPPADPFVAPPNLNVPNDVVVRGTTAARPVVSFGPGTGFFLGSASVLRDLDIEYAGDGVAIQFTSGASPSVIERVFVHSDGATAFAPCFVTGDATIRDSVCWADTASPNAWGMEVRANLGADFIVNIRNSTVISSSSQAGMLARTSGGTAAVNVTNSIVRSDTGADIQGQDLASAEPISVVLDHSNYATEADPGGLISITNPGTPTNQTAAPAFVDAPGGDFHQTASSAGTLNLGTATGLLPGELDLDGNARSQGPAPDIGAYEMPFVAAAARRRRSPCHHPAADDQEEEVQEEEEEAQRRGGQEEEVQEEEAEVAAGA